MTGKRSLAASSLARPRDWVLQPCDQAKHCESPKWHFPYQSSNKFNHRILAYYSMLSPRQLETVMVLKTLRGGNGRSLGSKELYVPCDIHRGIMIHRLFVAVPFKGRRDNREVTHLPKIKRHVDWLAMSFLFPERKWLWCEIRLVARREFIKSPCPLYSEKPCLTFPRGARRCVRVLKIQSLMPLDIQSQILVFVFTL